jgi:HD-like signal output (HDOD) protein
METDKTAAVPVLSRILAQLQRGDIQIPSAPAVVTELRMLVGNPDSKIEAIVALLERDQALVARVLQLGRSAASAARSSKAADLPSIINRVGFRQIGNVVETVWTNRCFQIPDDRYRPIAARLQRHSLARALAMRALAEQQRMDAFSAYLIGLFADVGASFLLWAIVNKSRGKPPAIEDALTFIREHHETIGGAVLKRWGHTEIVTNLVRRHHAASPPPQAGQLWNLFIVSAQVARELTQEDDLTVLAPWPSSELFAVCAEAVNLGEEQRAQLVTKLHDEYAAALDALLQA